MGKKWETVADFIFLGSKIIADGDCSHEIKRCLLLGRKAMTNLDSILKSGDITLLPKGRLVKARIKNLPALQETWVQFQDQEVPLEKEMARFHLFYG